MEVIDSGKASVFENEIISALIFRYLDVDSLKHARLVCRKWSKYGWRQLSRYTAQVRLDEDDKVQQYIDSFSRPDAVSPFRNYVLCYDFKNAEVLTKFYKIFGPQMRSLDISTYSDVELDHDDQKNLKSLERFAFSCIEIEFPIIDELILQGDNTSLEIYYSGSMKEVLPELGEFLKRNAQVLKHLTFDDEHSLWDIPPLPLVKIIVEAGFLKLQSLQLCGFLDDESMVEFAAGDIKTKKLDIGIADHSPDSLCQLLASQKHTLEQLTLGVSSKNFVKVKNYIFPKMEKLTFLRAEKLEGCFEVLGHENFPALEILNLSRFKLSLNQKSEITTKEIESKLRSCEIYFDSFEHGVKDVDDAIESLALIHPKLERLFIWGQVSDEHEELITKRFRNMKNLELSPESRA